MTRLKTELNQTKALKSVHGPIWTFLNVLKSKGSICCQQCMPSSETQGRLAEARGNKPGKKRRRRFTSKAERAPGNRFLSDHFQTALPMLPPDWAEKSFALFCPIGEQQLLRYCGVFLHNAFRIAIFRVVFPIHKHSISRQLKQTSHIFVFVLIIMLIGNEDYQKMK